MLKNYGLQNTSYRDTFQAFRRMGIRSYSHGSGYDYELCYAVMMKKFEKELLQLSVTNLAQKRLKHIIQDDEIEIELFQLKQIFGATWKKDLEIATKSFFCDCGDESRTLVNYKTYVNDLDDICFKGFCSSCHTIAVRYMETGERKGIELITRKIRKLNQ